MRRRRNWLTPRQAERILDTIIDTEGALRRAGATSEAIDSVCDALRRYRIERVPKP